jgi:CubicO group peptidase (beta-lactamase class C family)
MPPNVEKIREYLLAAIGRRVFPGCALGWVEDARESIITLGRYTYDEGAAAVTEKSLFDCASVTKAIPVSALALWMIDRKAFGLDDSLVDFVPEYRGSFRESITVKHLLTHTLDFDFRLSECKGYTPEKLLDAILNVKMKTAPGEKFCYANATSILLGMLIEKASGKPLHVLAKEVFFDPLGMSDTTFYPEINTVDSCSNSKIDNNDSVATCLNSRINDNDVVATCLNSNIDNNNIVATCVPTEVDDWRGRAICGEVHDESAWTLRKIMTVGSAGMFSTVSDLLKFVRMLIDGWEPFFSPKTIEAMHTNQIPNINGQCTGLGWELNQPYMGTNRTASTFGKTGFTGCAVIIDRPQKRGLVLLSNYTWPKRKPNRDLINEVRANIADLVFC